jgi:DNA-binding NarL/FixJ family response regulator
MSEILNWALRLSMENLEAEQAEEPYLIPVAVDRLARRLEYARGMLIGLLGPRGVGKSRALRWIAWRLTCLKKPCFLIRMRPKSQIYDVVQEAESRLYYDAVLAKLILEKLKGMSRDERYKYVFPSNDDFRKLIELADEREALRIISRNLDKLKTMIDETVHTVLIDLPDYSSKRALLRDLDQVQSYWRIHLSRKRPINIVVTLQGEAFNPADHYLFGKMVFYRLEPFKPEELFNFFKKLFPENPFSDDAILRIAQAAGGNMREFKMLAVEALETYVGQPRITMEMVESILAPLLLNRGEDRLRQAFHSMEQRELALKILEILKTGVNQRQAAKTLGLSEATVSRALNKLRRLGLA